MTVRSLRPRALGALCALLLLPAQARAHGHLLHARPGAGDTVHVSPRLIRLVFSEAPEVAVSAIRLVDSLHREIRLAPVHIDPESARVLIANLSGHLSPGRYTVMWQMAGRDGHPVRGQYDFVFVDDAPRSALPAPAVLPPGLLPPPGARREPIPLPAQTHLDQGFDSESTAYVLVRWAHFIGLLTVIGGVAFYWLVLGRAQQAEVEASVVDESAARARRVTIAGAALLAVATLARLLAQWTALRVTALDPSAIPLGRVVWDSAWGHAWLLEVGALLVAIAGLLLARRVSARRTGWGMAAVGAIGLAWSPALSGHAAVSERMLPIILDTAHVLAAGSWMGALLLVLVAGLPAARKAAVPARAMAALVNTFSSAALVSAAVVVLTGLVATWRNVEGLAALVYSPYGRVLLLKLALLAVAALIGLYNWLRATPALATSGDDALIRRTMRAELAAAVLILLATAILVAIPTPANLVSMT